MDDAHTVQCSAFAFAVARLPANGKRLSISVHCLSVPAPGLLHDANLVQRVGLSCGIIDSAADG
jgi:hypothetical protein